MFLLSLMLFSDKPTTLWRIMTRHVDTSLHYFDRAGRGGSGGRSDGDGTSPRGLLPSHWNYHMTVRLRLIKKLRNVVTKCFTREKSMWSTYKKKLIKNNYSWKLCWITHHSSLCVCVCVCVHVRLCDGASQIRRVLLKIICFVSWLV